MTAPTVHTELAGLLADLRGGVPSINPVDIFCCVITEELAKITELDASLI